MYTHAWACMHTYRVLVCYVHTHWFCTVFGLILAMKSFHCLSLLMEGVVIPCPAKEFKCFLVNLRARLLKGPRDSVGTPGVAAAGELRNRCQVTVTVDFLGQGFSKLV